MIRNVLVRRGHEQYSFGLHSHVETEVCRLSCWPQGITTGEMAGFHGEWKPRQSKLYRFGFLVDRSFGDFGKRLVRGFLLVERFLKKVGCVLQPQFFRPGAEGAVA